MLKVYNSYFAKDKPLRHVSQHLFIAIISYFIIINLFDINNSIQNLFVFVLFTYLIDVDGFISIFTTCKKIPEAQLIRNAIKESNFIDAATLATKFHKKFNKLIFHNIAFLSIALLIFIFSVYSNSNITTLISGAILSHFLFDIFDDLIQLKHVKNWLRM